LQRAPHQIIPPGRLMRYVWRRPLQFPPGSRYQSDNSDNTVIALMARVAAGRSYRTLLRGLVYRPAGLGQTSLPAGSRLPRPYLHGYALQPGHPAEDVSEAFSASAAWAAGGIVSTPADTNPFVRAYLGPRFFSRQTQAAQLRFVPGSSQPAGPGTNAAGLGIFRYRTRCGTMYGHTGNLPGYTQLAAASRGGGDSVSVTATEQLSRTAHPRVLAALRHAELLAVCTAMAPH
jgi:D-alanyl-D-alanine carboxypeptidase